MNLLLTITLVIVVQSPTGVTKTITLPSYSTEAACKKDMGVIKGLYATMKPDARMAASLDRLVKIGCEPSNSAVIKPSGVVS